MADRKRLPRAQPCFMTLSNVVICWEQSHLFDVAGSDAFGWVGVAGYVLLGSVAEASFEFVGVGVGGLGEPERERVTQVVGSERTDVALGFGMFCVVEPADTFEDGVDAAAGEAPVGAAAAHRSGGQEQRGGLVGGVERSFYLQVVGEGVVGVDGEEHGSLGFSFAPNTHDPGPAGSTQQCWLDRLDLVDVK